MNPMRESLDRDGWFLAERALDAAWVARLRRAFDAAPAQSEGTQHVRPDDATPDVDAWRALETLPILVAAATHVLGTFRLRDVHGRNPLPGFGQQGHHADAAPRPPGAPFSVVSAIAMLDDFTVESGATRVVPGSHRLAEPIPKSLAQPGATHPRERVVTGPAGSVLVFNGHVWHSGRRNASPGPRRAVQIVIVR